MVREVQGKVEGCVRSGSGFGRLTWVVVLAATAVLSALVAVVASAPSARAGTGSPSTFTYTGGEQTYAVPPGVTAVTITAVGAPGGAGYGSAGGYGANVTATVPVPSGTTTLYVEVGGAGPAWSCSPRSPAFNGGGAPSCGAGGGGASDVRLSPATTPLTTTDSRLVVAGGGGGGATGDACGGPGGSAGDTTVTGAGAGGAAEANNSLCPSPPSTTSGSNGGFGGSQGGAGGPNSDYPGGDGGAGTLGQGGAGGSPQGGAGGGGYFGGGGGGAGYPGGGGGAGSSYWVPTATETSMSTDTTGVPEVEITPIIPCTPTGFYRDNINLTAAQIGGDVTGTLDASGCDIGVYYGPGSTGSVSGATIANARYFGVVNDGRTSLTVENSTISNIGNSPFDGTQHGVGILYTTEHVLGTPTGKAGGTISGNSLPSYQKGGIVIRGTGASATIQNNTVTGQGMIDYIAQNGIQISYGASALVKGNTVSGNWYTPKSYVACGLLFYHAAGVKQQGNNLLNNEVDLCNAGRGGGNFNP